MCIRDRRSKWNWQFTPQLSLRVIMQYNSVLANTPGTTFYPYTYLPTEKQFNADFLLTYLVHPGTAIYVGYNSDLQNLEDVYKRQWCILLDSPETWQEYLRERCICVKAVSQSEGLPGFWLRQE